MECGRSERHQADPSSGKDLLPNFRDSKDLSGVPQLQKELA